MDYNSDSLAPSHYSEFKRVIDFDKSEFITYESNFIIIYNETTFISQAQNWSYKFFV